MLNFTVGPVMSKADVLEIGGQSSPYFRTTEFSNVMLENERLMLDFLNAPADSRCIFLTTSGTGAMESCVMNLLGHDDKAIVINGGSFGQRFVELCELHDRKYTEIKCEFGRQIKAKQLEKYSGCGYTTLLVNMGETSSGTLYDMQLIADFCHREHIFLIVDAISSFIADELDMSALGAGAVITGSQKALAVHPGIALVALSPEALERVNRNDEICMYLSMKRALKNGDRGQTPFTPAVTTLLEINARLKGLKIAGGVAIEHKLIVQRSIEFRKFIRCMPKSPFEFVSESMSNAVTSLHPKNVSATSIFNTMKE
ncbi:MAG: aminotransferase class V-fold PLP-dependent enzyme [Selenomonas sp.]|jgi:aspartate aminotransferase-like enzyme|nr:aminotransferase class V-fold PLP-dependent enzyme [Selenomonas sp.]